MQISDLKPRQGKVDIEVEVVSIDPVREFQKFGKVGRVANCTVKDDSGEIKLTLWNDDIDKVKVGSKIKITNGYINEFQGEMQLTAGRFGKLEVIDKGSETISEETKEFIEDEIKETTEDKPEEIKETVEEKPKETKKKSRKKG